MGPARVWWALMCGALVLGAALPARAQVLRAGGTGSALGTIALLSKAYARHNPSQGELEIVPNLGSSGSLRALQGGAIDIALVSRPLTADEKAAGLSALEYGRSPFVLVTNKPGVKNLTSADVVAFLSGRVAAWPDGRPVRLVLRPKSDIDTALLNAMAPEIAQALDLAHRRPGMVVAATDQDAADQAEKLPGSISTNTLALLLSEGRQLKAIALDGVEPTVQAVADGSYRHYKSMQIVTRGAAGAAAKRFVAFVRSREGRAILEANGHLVAP